MLEELPLRLLLLLPPVLWPSCHDDCPQRYDPHPAVKWEPRGEDMHGLSFGIVATMAKVL